LIGVLLVKELPLADPHGGLRVADLRLRELQFLSADVPLYDVLKIFRMGRAHMACLTRQQGEGLTWK
jgi:metal transporter CNNM